MKNNVTSALVAIAFVLMILGCGNRGNHENMDQNGNEDQEELPLLDSVTELTYAQCNAIIVGEGVRIRSNPNLKAEITDKCVTGDLVRIVKSSDERMVIDKGGSPCDQYGYYWYEVITADGQKGWVYGKFVYNIITKGKRAEAYAKKMNEMMDKSLLVNNEPWFIGFAHDNSYPVIGEQGLSGCDDFYMVYLYQKQRKKVQPVKFMQEKDDGIIMETTRENNWMLFTQSEGFEDVIHAFHIESPNVFITIQRQYQEGDDFFDICISFDKGVLNASITQLAE